MRKKRAARHRPVEEAASQRQYRSRRLRPESPRPQAGYAGQARWNHLAGLGWPTEFIAAGRSRPALRAAVFTLLLLGLSIGVSAAGRRRRRRLPKPGEHVYLLRGAFNIFSLGMDEIAARVERMGVATTVTNYLGWESLADEAAAA